MRHKTVLPSYRIRVIDVTRGAAVLGIFVINVQDMAFPESLAFYLHRDSPGPELNKYIGLFFEIFFYGKMLGLFSVLFGVSSVLIMERLATQRGGPYPARFYFSRLFWLAMFGLLNAYVLLWWGDVLFKYALIGVLLFPLRMVPVRSLLVVLFVGFTLLTAQSVVGYVEVAALQERVADIRDKKLQGQALTVEEERLVGEWQEIQSELRPDYSFIDEEVQVKTGSYLELFKYNSERAFEEQTVIFVSEELLGLILYMMLGVVLFRLGIFAGAGCQPYGCLVVAFVGLGVGVFVHAWLNIGLYEARLDPVSLRYYEMFFELGRLPFVLGYIFLIIYAFRMSFLKSVGDCLAAVGRMALTNYLLHSIIGALVFYGFGLMQFNQLSRLELVIVIALVWILQIIGSVFWMARFRYGPVEWLWRSLTYGAILSIRKS